MVGKEKRYDHVKTAELMTNKTYHTKKTIQVKEPPSVFRTLFEVDEATVFANDCMRKIRKSCKIELLRKHCPSESELTGKKIAEALESYHLKIVFGIDFEKELLEHLKNKFEQSSIAPSNLARLLAPIVLDYFTAQRHAKPLSFSDTILLTLHLPTKSSADATHTTYTIPDPKACLDACSYAIQYGANKKQPPGVGH